MSENVIRRDIIEVGFDANLKVLKEITGQLDDIKKAVNGTGESDGFDKVKKQANNANDSAKKLNTTLSKVGSTLGRVAKKAAGLTFKATAVGIGACATAIGTLAAKSVSAYGDFEQLQGGVETLFKGSASTVQKYANDAYKTSGLSANEYMETVTGFSASLIQSLGGDTKKAAEYGQIAITDMSDNANKMGTDMGSIQYAYQGFAKQNYTMLDNLKLGYGGTKTEMERLVKDAAKIDKSVKSNSLSYANVVKAIHAVQTKMGITGTTAKEANFTIQGSVNSMKAAWGNLLPALIKGGDEFDQCVNNLVESIVGVEDKSGKMVGGVLNNVMPALEKGLEGIGKLIEKVAPIIEDRLPDITDKLLPPLIKAATSLFKGLIKALPSIVRIIVNELPNIAKQLGQGISEAFGENSFVEKAFNSLASSLEWIKANFDKVKKGALGTAAAIGGAVLAFKGFKAFKSIQSLFGKGSGGKSGGGSGLLGGLSNLKVKDIGKLVLIIGALGALLWVATKAFKGGIDFTEMIQVIALVGILGLVGAGLANLAGIVGKIKVATVAKGLANIAIIVAGMGALLWLATKVFSDGINFREMIQVITLIGILGTVGSVLAVFAGVVGCIPFPVVIAGLGNIATVIGGFTAILWALNELQKIPGFKEFIKGGGEVLETLANILGKAIGSIIGGIGEGITNSLPKIGENLAKFGENVKPFFQSMSGVDMGGVGEFVKSLAGLLGIATGNSIVDGIKSLFGGDDEGAIAQLGTQLTNFAKNATGFFTAMKAYGEEDFKKIAGLFNALGSIKALPSSGGFVQYLTGDPYNGMLKMAGLLPMLAPSVASFFTILGGRTDFSAITSLFNALSSVKALPSAGGVFQYFTGDPYKGLFALINLLPMLAPSLNLFFTVLGGRTDFSAITSLFNALSSVKELPKAGGFAQFFTGDPYAGLKNLIGLLPSLAASVGIFFQFLGGITDFSTIPALFNALASVKELPKAGGFAQFFTGDVYAGLKEMITWLPLLGASTLSFFTSVAGIDDFSKIGKLFDALADVNKLPEDDGFWTNLGDAITGQETMSQMELMSKDLKTFGENTKEFFAQINSLNLSNLNGLWESLKKPEEITDNLSTIIGNKIDELVDKITELPVKMGEGLKSTGQSLSDALVSIWKNAVKASVSPVNKVISGANWIMEQFGSDKRVSSWKPYAKGTGGHRGGNALVNDGRGAELIQMPNGRTFIPQGRNVFMPNAPKGMKVLPAEQTARLLGRNKPTYRYAEGNIDIWSYLDNASGLVKRIIENVSYERMGTLAKNIGKGMISTISNPMSAWIEKAFSEVGSLASYVPGKGVSQWRTTVIRALKMEGQYSAANVARTLYQMQTESGGNPRAINLWDSNAKKGIPSKGLMQVIDPTFKAYARPGFNKDIYDPLSNILASVRYATSRYGSLQKAYRGVGYSKGVGEISLPRYSPESNSATITSSRTSNTEYNSYSPVFNLTINGSSDERKSERKVKRWVKESMDEVFESMSRKNPRLREV